MKYICKICGKEFDTEELGSLPYFDDLHEINKHVMQHVNLTVYEDTCKNEMFFDIYVMHEPTEPATDEEEKEAAHEDPMKKYLQEFYVHEKDATAVYRWLQVPMKKHPREFYVHEKDVTTVYRWLQEFIPSKRWKTISIGWCGWSNAPDCWWVRVPLTPNESGAVIDWLEDPTTGVELYNPALIR